jgi:hypothetical protein
LVVDAYLLERGAQCGRRQRDAGLDLIVAAGGAAVGSAPALEFDGVGRLFPAAAEGVLVGRGGGGPAFFVETLVFAVDFGRQKRGRNFSKSINRSSHLTF